MISRILVLMFVLLALVATAKPIFAQDVGATGIDEVSRLPQYVVPQGELANRCDHDWTKVYVRQFENKTFPLIVTLPGRYQLIAAAYGWQNDDPNQGSHNADQSAYATVNSATVTATLPSDMSAVVVWEGELQERSAVAGEYILGTNTEPGYEQWGVTMQLCLVKVEVPTPTSTATPTPTATSIATSTPTSTATSIATSTPTSTAVTTATPTPCISEIECATHIGNEDEDSINRLYLPIVQRTGISLAEIAWPWPGGLIVLLLIAYWNIRRLSR